MEKGIGGKPEMTIMKAIKENKSISGALLILFGLLMSWGVWVTNGMYEKKAAVEIDRKTIQSMIEVQSKTVQVACVDIDNLKKEDVRIEKELKEMINNNQLKIMMILLDIQKKVK